MRSIQPLLRSILLANHIPKYNMNHIKNMLQENVRVRVEEIDSTTQIQASNRVYKPTYTIEFNREGEVLLYSANPIKNQTLYFKYPYILYESLIPLSFLNYALDPLSMAWYWSSFFLYASPALTIPRIWYFSDFKWCPQKLFLLRGGRVLKVESISPGAQRFVYWIETWVMKPLTADKMRFDDPDNADFLTEEGQLNYDLTVQTQQFKYFGTNTNNQLLYFKQHGTVHHPQLFEAAVKGYNIDTTDFVINTADNIRYRQGNHDQ